MFKVLIFENIMSKKCRSLILTIVLTTETNKLDTWQVYGSLKLMPNMTDCGRYCFYN